MKVKCIESFSVQKCDDDGFEIENKYVEVKKDSIWEIDENIGRIIGGEVRLTEISDNWRWLEISKELFEECFKRINQS